jgi:hypothetical protein
LSSAAIVYTLRKWLGYNGDIDIYAFSRVDRIFPFVIVEPGELWEPLEFLPQLRWHVTWDCTVEQYNRKRWGELFPLIGVPFFTRNYPSGEHLSFVSSALYSWIMGRYHPKWILLQQPLTREDILELSLQYRWIFQTFSPDKKREEWLEAWVQIREAVEPAIIRHFSPEHPACRMFSWQQEYVEYPVGVKPPDDPNALATLKIALLHPAVKTLPARDPEIPHLIRVGRYALKNAGFRIRDIPKFILTQMEEQNEPK